MAENEQASTFVNLAKKESDTRRVMRILLSRKLTVVGMVIILITLITAIFAPLLAPYDPYATNMKAVLQPPSSQHLLGTDPGGRDTLSRLIFGARTSMIVGVAAVALAAVIGLTLGTIAGYFGGIPYTVIMRLTDMLMSFPWLLLALTIAALLGSGLRNVIMALTVGLLASYTRLMCGQVLSVKFNDYILAQKSIGTGNGRIMLRHVLPNCFPPLIVFITLMIGSTILVEASLSFLGVGIVPPTASWGSMVNEGYRYILTQPLLSTVPGLTLMLVVFSFNMVGDGLRDALDPRLRGML